MAATLLAGCASPAQPSADQRADVRTFVQVQLDAAWKDRTQRYTRPSTAEPLFYLPNGWGFKMQQCMIESGYPTFNYFEDDGSRKGEKGLAWYVCLTAYPTYDTVYNYLDDTVLDELYVYYLDWLIPCISVNGFEVEAIPSRTEFGEGGSGQPGSWNPYLTMAEPASVSIAEVLLDACPAYPENVMVTP